MVAEVDVVTAAACTVTLAVFAPTGTTTPAGTGKAALLLERATVAPPVGAAALSVTVTVVLAPPVMLADVTATELRLGNTAGVIVIVMLAVFALPL
jgi:hypothetical protein